MSGIERQHLETEIPELYGRRCRDFVAVLYSDGVVGSFYIRFEEHWHHFHLSAGVLFWREGHEGPHPENDFLEREEVAYRDLAAELGVVGVPIVSVMFKDNMFSMEFENGALLRLQDEVFGEPKIVEVRTPSSRA